MKHKLFIKMLYLKMIREGIKSLEARANYPNLRNIKIKDEIIFMSGNLNVSTLVKRVILYKSVEEMLNHENVEHLIPGLSLQEAKDIYNTIYPPKKIAKNGGIKVFELELL